MWAAGGHVGAVPSCVLIRQNDGLLSDFSVIVRKNQSLTENIRLTRPLLGHKQWIRAAFILNSLDGGPDVGAPWSGVYFLRGSYTIIFKSIKSV